MIEFEWGEERAQVHPEKVVFLPESRTLFLADLHLGKEAVFQKSGIPIPSGATKSTLEDLDRILNKFHPHRIMILGDLLHASVGLTPELELGLRQLLERWCEIEWMLVAGNHDRGAHRALRSLGLAVAKPPVICRNIQCCHDPIEAERDGFPSSQLRPIPSWCIAGHLHPSVLVPLGGKDRARLPCFWVRDRMMVLPAFGGWTGTRPIQPSRRDRVFVCIDREVIELYP